MSGDLAGGPVGRLGDLNVVIAPGRTPNGSVARIVVTDSRNRRMLIRLHPREAYAFGVVLTAKAKAAGAPAAAPGVTPSGGRSAAPDVGPAAGDDLDQALVDQDPEGVSARY